MINHKTTIGNKFVEVEKTNDNWNCYLGYIGTDGLYQTQFINIEKTERDALQYCNAWLYKLTGKIAFDTTEIV